MKRIIHVTFFDNLAIISELREGEGVKESKDYEYPKLLFSRRLVSISVFCDDFLLEYLVYAAIGQILAYFNSDIGKAIKLITNVIIC